MTVHIVYPYGPRKAAPWSIGNHLAAAFRGAGCEVKQYDWEDCGTITPVAGDTLVGHPHDSGARIFNQSVRKTGWARRVALAPWNGSELYTRRLMSVANHCDAVLAICGPTWADRLPAGWTRLDMAIDPEDYPRVKTSFNPPGQRKILFIGCTLPCKGPALLTELAKRLPGTPISHVGPGLVPGTHPWGYVPMESEAGQQLAAQHDILIAPGLEDANPTTVLEAMAWGLVPAATRESGWSSPPVVRLTQDPAVSSETLSSLLYSDARMLERIVERNVFLLGTCYTWDRFCGSVLATCEVKNGKKSA